MINAIAAMLLIILVLLLLYTYYQRSQAQGHSLKGVWHIPAHRLKQFGLQAFLLLNESKGNQYLYIENDSGVLFDQAIAFAVKKDRLVVLRGPSFIDQAVIVQCGKGYNILDRQQQLLAYIESCD